MSEEGELPPQIQEQLLRLQQMEQTLQAIVAQKQQLELELAEAEKAISELEKIDEKVAVYKSIGSILLEADKQSLLNELKERKELLTTRVTVLSKQEERTRAKIKEAQLKLQEKLKGQP